MERRFRKTFDPFVAAQAAAAVTERLRVGSAISLLAQHEPIAMAKRLASLDRLVDGRLDVGVGAGWIEDEMRRRRRPGTASTRPAATRG
ncbi:LLM class flavin-dependent oxidoreductase [Streptomyces huasconensis]|uniref:LLM class flavin-dependent oxidoreductase n=1 Tax=Streptomyces huasconensis TaxID=1854574 RepID=UPI003701BEAE